MATTTAPCELMSTDTRKNTKAIDHGYFSTISLSITFISEV